ncbi:excinuclease ABC subunit UvrA [candidate division WOR-3 bacterium]|nr:excinuclease ABC subunit UvrA [candidate division WOR-3 bacterium]
MSTRKISIKGVRVHNLKNINVEIPRDKLVVITGISGSGKSSLAFDTIYAEGQRRYVESLSAYARQFLGIMDKPDLDFIEGLSPAISIQQRTASKNPRSTVGTVTEIYDYLRLLFAHIGVPYCYKCGKPITKQTSDQITDAILEFPKGEKIMVLAPIVRSKKGEHKEILKSVQRKGFVRVRINGKIYEIEDIPKIDKNRKHLIEIVVDRLITKKGMRKRVADSVEMALREGEGQLIIAEKNREDILFSELLACPHCNISYGEITPRFFSFNSPFGACSACSGLGTKMEIDEELLIINDDLSILEGTIGAWGEPRGKWILSILDRLSKKYSFDLNTSWGQIPEDIKEILLYGEDEEWGYEGIIPNLMRRYKETESDWIRYEIEKYMSVLSCPVCEGARLKKESLSIIVHGKNLNDIVQMSVKESLKFFEKDLVLTEREKLIVYQVIKEIRDRLSFLVNVGLNYVTLSRSFDSLSGGEMQRVHLATQIGSGLMGVLYILDEPSVGLHQRDNKRLLRTLRNLRDIGNTVIVVEHDKQTILSADHIIDLGPGAGEYGGEVVASGKKEDIVKKKKSITGMYLSGKRKIKIPTSRRKPAGRFFLVKQAKHNNLKSIDVKIPLGLFVCITGVSGSGKSSLMNDIVFRALAKCFYRSRRPVGEYKSIEGLEYIDKVINIDQSPIGRTPRSNPATYTGLFTYVRELFSSLHESRMRGYKPGRFSFNVKGGRCEACRGNGIIRIEMHFLPDVYIPCEVCNGKRFNRETLDVRYKGKSVSDILNMTVTEAMESFKNIYKIKRRLQLLYDVGLGYIKLGQPATTLSGGEAQRVKLSKELSKIATGRTMYILDEPTTGLHFEDVKMLLEVLNKLVKKGNTVLIIEHNMDVIKSADYIIDLGPEGGDEGGYIVAEGTPEEIARCKKSYTGKYLAEELNMKRVRSRSKKMTKPEIRMSNK